MFLVMNAFLGVCFLPFKGREIWELAEKREELMAVAKQEADGAAEQD